MFNFKNDHSDGQKIQCIFFIFLLNFYKKSFKFLIECCDIIRAYAFMKNYIETSCMSFIGRRSNFVGRHLKFPWERTSEKNLFYHEYNQFEKIPQNDDSDNQNESA